MSRQELRAFICLILAMALLAISGFSCSASAAGYPPQAERYRRDLIRSARYVWGMSAPIAVLAAQVHQESGWIPTARSAYASGLAQFTPGTARDMARMYPRELAGAKPLDPRWALMALCRYDKQLYDAMPFAASPADRWAFALSAYNGGPGWIARDRAKASAQGLDSTRWWGNVEAANSGRALQFFRENRDYPRRIMLRHQPLYVSWGPGIGVQEVPDVRS